MRKECFDWANFLQLKTASQEKGKKGKKGKKGEIKEKKSKKKSLVFY